ncbi:imidazole glycerol phosphate synthase subunit HisH, partial [uncultured Dysgonomonas sp.]|uniref:imidazole glycerol phosphate synthase subunit HisH n=1 Tax=uncultured Dysgonomonas sp. TaxID=206096 RepID=UPI00260DF14C
MIIILDYGVGNLTSIKKMLTRCGAEAIISKCPKQIADADKYILPGVGSFDHGISNLKSAEYFQILEKKILEEKKPILGVCLGMQLIAGSSEEGTLPGLNWLPGNVIRFKKEKIGDKLKIPNMGWSDVSIKKPSRIFTDMVNQPRFYFVHSYHWECTNVEDELVTAV